MTVRADAKSPLAQIPLTIFLNTTMLKMVTLNGSDTEWREISVDIDEGIVSFYLKLYFALDGMEIRDMKVELVEELNEELLEMLIRED
jgi:beta-glucosidase